MKYIHCQACTNEKYGVVTKIPVLHVCAKSVKGRKAKGLKQEYFNSISDNTYVKVWVVQLKAETAHAGLWQLSVQYCNNFLTKVKTEVWFPKERYLEGEMGLREKFIWVEKSHYDKLVFVN